MSGNKKEFCPHCGGSLSQASILKAGQFSYSEQGGFKISGYSVILSDQMKLLIQAIMAARGSIVDYETLSKATKTRSTNPTWLIQTVLTQAKSRVREQSLESLPISVIFKQGMRWSGPVVEN